MLNSKNIFNLSIASSMLLIAACGGGSGSSPVATDEQLSWKEGVFDDQTVFQNQCQVPRSGTDINGDTFPDRDGSNLHEKHFLRSFNNNTYLWYDEVVDRDPALTESKLAYFDLLVTTETTASGNPKDNFHFTYDSAEWLQLNQAGISVGYGVKWTVINAAPPREVRAAYTEPNSPATTANVIRGEEVIEVDGIDVINDSADASVDLINAALFPKDSGETHSFVLRDVMTNETRTVQMTSANITSTPVKNTTTFETDTGTVGYLQFNSHNETAEQGLLEAFTELEAANVSDLVLDLRYNGGGLLAIASQVGYMIAGLTATSGKTFEDIVFNDKHPSTNPVTGQPLSPTPFYSQSLGFSVTEGQSLPSLNLDRVFILSTARTCSASEAIINGLNGINVEVILVGGTTCGKPYGFYPQDNCGTTYFTIQFKGENDVGFGDYSDGFSPANTQGTVGEIVTGCSVADDFTKALGDATEAQLAAALAYRDTQTCPVPSGKMSARYKTSRNLKGSLFNSQIYTRYHQLETNRFIQKSH